MPEHPVKIISSTSCIVLEKMINDYIAMDVVLHKEFARINKKNAIEIDAIFLWELHQQLGFGPKRLKDFFMGFHPAYQSLIHKYEYDTEEDGIWLGMPRWMRSMFTRQRRKVECTAEDTRTIL